MYSGDYGRDSDRFRGAFSGRRQPGNEWRDDVEYEDRSPYRGGEREVGRNWSQDMSRNRQETQDYGNRGGGRDEHRDNDRMYSEGRDYPRSGRRHEGYDADREGGREGSRGPWRQQDYQDFRDGGTQRWSGSQRGRNPGGMGEAYDTPRFRDSSQGWMSQGDGSDTMDNTYFASRYGNNRSQGERSQQQDDYRSQYGSHGGSQSGYANQMGRHQGMQSSHAGKGPKGWKRSDERICEEVNEALARHAGIDASEIEVEVKNGEVTLTGSVADREEKRMVEDVAECVFGVNDVQNSLRVSRGADVEVNRTVERDTGRQTDGMRSTRDGGDKNRKGTNSSSLEATAG